MAEMVECRSDASYAERPVAFTWEGQRLEVEAVIVEWRTPDGKHFRIHTGDGREFELSYANATDEWQILER